MHEASTPFEDDTTLEALRYQHRVLRSLPMARRIALMDDLTLMARSMSWQGLRHRHPDLGEAELEKKFFELTLGRELAHEVLEYRRAHTGR